MTRRWRERSAPSKSSPRPVWWDVSNPASSMHGFFYAVEAKNAKLRTVALALVYKYAEYTVTILNRAPHPTGAAALVRLPAERGPSLHAQDERAEPEQAPVLWEPIGGAGGSAQPGGRGLRACARM